MYNYKHLCYSEENVIIPVFGSCLRHKRRKFKALATGFLSTCDKNNRLNTFALLRGPVKDLDDQTPMQIAFDCEFKEFVAQTSFQKLLDKFWAKRIIDCNKNFYFPVSY